MFAKLNCFTKECSTSLRFRRCDEMHPRHTAEKIDGPVAFLAASRPKAAGDGFAGGRCCCRLCCLCCPRCSVCHFRTSEIYLFCADAMAATTDNVGVVKLTPNFGIRTRKRGCPGRGQRGCFPAEATVQPKAAARAAAAGTNGDTD